MIISIKRWGTLKSKDGFFFLNLSFNTSAHVVNVHFSNGQNVAEGIKYWNLG